LVLTEQHLRYNKQTACLAEDQCGIPAEKQRNKNYPTQVK
jgi:hypothetical protein